MQLDFQQQFNLLKLVLIALVFPALILTQTACNMSTASNNKPQLNSSSKTSAENVPTSLRIALLVNASQAQRAEQKQNLTEYLNTTLKRPVFIEEAKDYNTAVNLLVEGKVQVARLGPLSYIKAKQRNPQIEAIAAAINKSTGRPWYKSAIVVNSASGIKTLENLKGKRIGFVSKLSTSGFMFPAVHLLDLGFNFDSDFASIQFYKSHDKTFTALLEGQVDAVAIQLDIYNQAKATGKIKDSYRVIWTSEPIPESPIVVSQKLPPELIVDLKDAFISSPVGMFTGDGIPSNGYTLMQDSDYDRVRQVKKQLDERLGSAK